MNDTAEILDDVTLRELYESIKDENSASYKVWLKKLHRAAEENPRTVLAVKRRLGIETRKPSNTQFVSYDGEGYGDRYVLLANSLGSRMVNPNGLSTDDCLEFLSERYSVQTKRVFFSFNYDINHILRDVEDEVLQDLLANRIVDWHGYKLQYFPGKIFVVNGFKYYDTFGFFQTSFINVVEQILGKEYVSEGLRAGKEARGEFETWDIERIIAYNDEELQLLVKIMDKLRSAFYDIGVYLKEWYGPGAVANYWFKEHGITPKEKHTTTSLLALNSAYYGGRFEQVSLGKIAPIYEYDIHSAYPAEMSELPYFLEFKKSKTFVDTPYSLWKVSFDFREYEISERSKTFYPLPMRSRDGRICFPLVGKGWYWYPEIKLVLDYFPDAKLTFHEGYIATTEGKPFSWVRELYDYRQRLKEAGNFSQYAIKVGINSLYGKCAQRVGSNAYFSLSWAGYTTSATRAKLARAGYDNGSEKIIGFATDAIFSTSPLDLPLTNDLGDWEACRFDSGLFLQSGVYRLQNNGEKPNDRYRGSPLRRGIDNLIEQLSSNPSQYPTIKIGRFISHLLAIRAPKAYQPYRLQFVQVPFEMKIDAPFKRHYDGFVVRIERDGKVVSDYGRLLKARINSRPKIWCEDYSPYQWYEYLYGNTTFENVESYPPMMKDAQLQKLIEDGQVSAFEAGYDILELVQTLPVIMEELHEV